MISQARFFRLLKIKPTDEDAAPFGGLNTVVITHQALLGKKKKLNLLMWESRICVLFHT